jgi:ligand-binding sensor domain-containing protein
VRDFIQRRPWRVALVCLVAVALLWAGSAFWRANQALRESSTIVASESQLDFTNARLDRHVPAGVEALNTPTAYRDAVSYQGRLYLCGPTGLYSFNADGSSAASYRTGIELPPAPLVRMATGLASDSSERELWIATAGEGLLAFDGKGFRQIRPRDADSRKLTSVLPLATGQILIGTEKKGVLAFDGKSLTPFHPTLSNFHVTALAGGDADVWIGTLDHGALHWHAGQVDKFLDGGALPDPQVLSLAAKADSAFVGTALGISEFKNGRFERVLAKGIFARSLLVHGNQLSVGTLEQGVFEIPLEAKRPRPASAFTDPLQVEITRLLELDDKVYALADDGLYAIDNRGTWKPVLHRPPAVLADRNISALSLDRAGRLWVGYFDRGLDVLENNLQKASHSEDEHVFCINRVAQDDARSLTAVATANGLVLFDAAANKKQVILRSDGLIANHVTDIVINPDGMTVATPAGLTFLDRGGMRSLYAFHGLVNNHAYALGQSQNRLMVGTLGGLSILDAGVVKASFTTSNSALRQNWITAIVPSSDEWFIGTYGSGVVRMDSAGTWQNFADMPKQTEINPNAMAAGTDRVYAGTLGKGLLIYSKQQGRWNTFTTGLPSLNVTALARGGGYLYVGTDNGLVRITEANL